MRQLFLILFLGFPISLTAQVSGSGTQGGTANIWLTSPGAPLPSGSMSASNTTPTQGTTITLTYSASGQTHCNINNGILSDTTSCSDTTASFVPPFSAPGPTSTIYTFTIFNGAGQVGIPVTVTVSAVILSGDDSIYSTGTAENCIFPGGLTTDGPAPLPIVCNDTKLADTPSPGSIRTVGYSGGVLTPATCTTDWVAAMAAVVAGDVVKVAQGCVIQCTGAVGCILPTLHGDMAHWTLIESVDPATGLPDVGFPAEGKRATQCDINLSSVAYYPDYSADCVARGGAKNRMFKILSNAVTAPALAIFDSAAVSPICTIASYPCGSYWRIQGMEATNKDAATRTSHKLVEFAACDHCIFDRGVLHSINDPLFRVEVQGGVNMNGSHISVINSTIYDIVCANAPSGSTCVDSQGVAAGTGAFPQVGHKIVNNLLAASGEAWFWGGGAQAYYPTAGNPDGNASDIEVRRNHSMHPLSWMLPYLLGPFTATSVDAAGNYQGAFLGGANNAFVGQKFKVAGFVNTANNIAGTMVTASSNTSLSFSVVTIPETHAGTATNQPPHWDTKNLGESKSMNRALWEANVSENSHMGWQSDQNGNAWLITTVNQTVALTIPSGDVLTGTNVAGLHYLNCTNGGVACSGVAGKALFICDLDPNALPDWTGAGTTVASCGGSVAFGCPIGTQVGCPGSYQKLCQSQGDITRCAVKIGTTYYHIQAVISSDQVQTVEDATAVVNASPVVYKRGLNPFASIRNTTIRYSIGRHLADGMEITSAKGDGGEESKGSHNISVHDILFYDVNPAIHANVNSCCNKGSAFELFSGTSVSSTVLTNISVLHNTAPVIGYQSSSASGLLNFFDNQCKPPLVGLVCANGISPGYFAGLVIRDNISSAALNMTAAGSGFTTDTQAFGAGFYGCSGHDGVTGCDYNIQKNLAPLGLWSGQTDQLPNLHLLGTNTVEACSCTTVANGGTCTPGSPNTWSSPVTTGSLDACNRTLSTYATIFNVWDPNGGPTLDLQLPSNSPYKNKASDGTDLGADVATVLTKTAGVALSTPITQIAINGYFGNFTCNDIAPCALPVGTHAVSYGIMLHRTTPNGPYTQWTLTGGALPAGMAIALGTGILSGIPSAAGDYSFSVTAADAAHSQDQQAYMLHVN